MKKQKRYINQLLVFMVNILLLLAVFVAGLISLISARRILMDNAHNMGEEIANGYVTEEEYNFEVYQSLIDIGSQYIADMLEREKDEASLEVWIKDYLTKINEVAGTEAIRPYAIVDDWVIAADVSEYGTADAIRQKTWYKNVINADGEIVFSDVYIDDLSNNKVITVAKTCKDTGAVIAFDIYPENFRIKYNTQILPEGSIYFLSDAKGTLLYRQTVSDMDEKQLDNCFEDLFAGAKNEDEGADYRYYDIDGERMLVYCREETDGWISILLIPESCLVKDWTKVMGQYFALFVLIFLAIFYMWLRQRRMLKGKRRAKETVQILGNAYYAFYRINIKTETYEMIKGCDYVSSVLPVRGRYQDLLDVFEGVISPESAYEEFVESFSLRNIKRQIDNHVEDFGGDFQRTFENDLKWVNVRILFAPSICADEVVLCFRQVEEEKRMQLKKMALLEDSLKAAQASDESQKQFFSSISHDMRTPLNVIIGMSEMAEKNIEDTDKARNYLQKINYSSRQLLGLINNILEMSRLDKGMYLYKEDFNLAKEIEKCIEPFMLRAKEGGKKLSFSHDVSHEEVRGDKTRLGQIINNLLSNAMSFTEEGDSISISLREIFKQKYSRYQILVSDTGVGMSEEFQEKMYLPYVREKRFNARDKEGIGLGLMIVKNVVTLMNGEIDVDSTEGVGTTVTVTLPMETVDENESEKAAQEKEPAAKEEENGKFSLKEKNILLTEDYELNMELATDILEMCEARVTQARNGKEALECFRASPPGFFDAILMDMQMPVMNGCEAATAIRALDREDAETVPIIAVTANTFAEDISNTVKAGMDAHVAKPIDTRILMSTLAKVIDKKQKDEVVKQEESKDSFRKEKNEK